MSIESESQLDEVDDTSMLNLRILVITGVTLWVCNLGSTAAWAQVAAPEAPEQDAGSEPAPERSSTTQTEGIEERVILAGESESMADFQAGDSVTGFDAADLEALGAQSIADIAKFTPNLEIVTTGATTPTFFIRGVGLNDFSANSSSAVAIYQDDVPLNSAALQLSTLFDVEAVNVLRGPQSTGAYRSASAGAIKLYAKKPSGGYGAYLRSQYGRFDELDFEGMVEAPIYEDILSSRFSFRFSDRAGFMKNGCGNDLAIADRVVFTGGGLPDVAPHSICGEQVQQLGRLDVISGRDDGTSPIPVGLPKDVNNRHVWAARGLFLFQPTLDMEWLVNIHGSRRDEQSRLGQSLGTRGNFCPPGTPIEDCYDPQGGTLIPPDGDLVVGLLGGLEGDNGGYKNPDVREMFDAAEARAFAACGPACDPRDPLFEQFPFEAARNDAKLEIAKKLASDLDSRPFRGDFNTVGGTANDVWGVSVKGEIELPGAFSFRTVSAYERYDRGTELDLDFSPSVLFEVTTDDEGWQFTQEVSLSRYVSDDIPLRFEVGGLYLMEELDVGIRNDFGRLAFVGVNSRDYVQKLWSVNPYASFSWDFFEDFTLDGGVRYNWERKTMDYLLIAGGGTGQRGANEDQTWQAPTGTIRLTYRFREDVSAYWKYSRGWKGGHFNATGSLSQGVTFADPEDLNAFEAGVSGSWFEGRLGLDLSFFYYDYDDYQLFTAENTFDAPPEFVIINASNARIFGSELDLRLRPLPGTFVNVRFSWLESEFIDFVQIQLVQRQFGDDFLLFKREIQNSGNRLLNSPQFKVSITAEQTVPLGRYGSVTARYDGAWSDITYYDGTQGQGISNLNDIEFLPEHTIAQKPYWLHNLRLGYLTPDGSIELAIYVRNMMNEAYKGYAFDANTFQSTTLYFIGDPRTYGGSLLVSF